MKHNSLRKLFLLLIVAGACLFSFNYVHAYSLTKERPIFLNWPLPSYIGVARISQFPNTPWTWNYLGLNPGMQCTPAFGYLEGWLSTWRDTSISWEQDSAQADPHQFQMIECYSTGGEAGTNGHEATDIKAPTGTPVYPSAEGKVAGWRLNDLNSMIVLKHCLGGKWDINNECENGTKWYTTYMHIVIDAKVQQMDLDVNLNTELGKIYNQGDNSHLHFEVGLDKRNYSNYVNPWGRDESPWLGCMWLDQSLCVQPNPILKQFLFINVNHQALLKSFYGPFIDVPHDEGAQSFQLNGNRLAVLQNDDALWVSDLKNKYDSNFNWIKVDEQVSTYEISQNRIGLLNKKGEIKIQEGSFTDQWGLQASGVKAFSISDHRVGVLGINGELHVMEGDLNSQWTPIAQNVLAFQLLDARIAYIDAQKNLIVQEGSLDSEWKLMGENIKAFQLSGVRVAMLNENGELWVNHGNLRAEFVLQAEDVHSFQLADNRIVIVEQDGKLRIKEGSLYIPWTDIQYFSAKEILLNGNQPIFVE